MGILIEDYGLETTNRGTFMRDLSLTDGSKGMSVATIWSEEAQNFKCDKFSVIVIRKAHIVEFEGKKKMNCLSGTLVCLMISNIYLL